MINQQTSEHDAWAFFDCKNSLFYVELKRPKGGIQMELLSIPVGRLEENVYFLIDENKETGIFDQVHKPRILKS